MTETPLDGIEASVVSLTDTYKDTIRVLRNTNDMLSERNDLLTTEYTETQRQLKVAQDWFCWSCSAAFVVGAMVGAGVFVVLVFGGAQ